MAKRRTTGYKFSVLEENVDRFINNFIPPAFRAAVDDLRRQAKEKNLGTSCLTHTFGGNAMHVVFHWPCKGEPAMSVAKEYLRAQYSDDVLRSNFKSYEARYGAVNFAILNPKEHAAEQI